MIGVLSCSVRRTVALLALGIAALAPATVACGRDGARPDEVVALRVDGHERTAVLHEPEDLPATPVPLVIVLHGFGGDGAADATSSGFSPVADAEGFVVAYPSGLDARWHDGSMGLFVGDVDDVAFLRALVDELAARRPIDRARVFVVGFSNGAGMAMRLACEAPDLVAGIAPISGGNVGTTLDRCDPSRPVAVMDVHGTDDPIIRYDGGDGHLGELIVPSFPVDALALFWAAEDGCATGPAVVGTPSALASPGGVTTTRDWTDCAAGTRVRFVRLDGGGHTWPDGVAAELWSFFDSLGPRDAATTGSTTGSTVGSTSITP